MYTQFLWELVFPPLQYIYICQWFSNLYLLLRLFPWIAGLISNSLLNISSWIGNKVFYLTCPVSNPWSFPTPKLVLTVFSKSVNGNLFLSVAQARNLGVILTLSSPPHPVHQQILLAQVQKIQNPNTFPYVLLLPPKSKLTSSFAYIIGDSLMAPFFCTCSHSVFFHIASC